MIKKTILFFLLFAGIATTSKAQISQQLRDSASYALGLDFARSLHTGDTTLNLEKIIEGVKDGYLNNVGKEFNEFMDVLNIYARKLKLEKQRAHDAMLAKTAADAQTTMDSLKKLPKMTASSTGLVYKITKKGGKAPNSGDKLVVHYVLMNADGTQTMESSYKTGNPLEFVNSPGRMIKGFMEAVQLIGKGGQITIYVPPHLGYGPNGNATVRPNQVIRFDIEVVDIIPTK